MHRVDLGAQVSRHDRFDAGQGPRDGVVDAGHTARRGLQGDRHGDGLLVVEQQRRQLAAHPEAVPALGSLPGMNRVTERAEAFHVPGQGPGTDPEPLSQILPRPTAASPKQGKQTKQTRGRGSHRRIVLQVADIRCPLPLPRCGP